MDEKSWPWRKKIICLKFLIVLLVGVFMLTGCNTLETLIVDKSEKTQLGEWIGVPGEENIPAISNLGDGRTVSLYFPDSTGTALVKEERTIPKTLSLARETVKQWLMGPSQNGDARSPVNPATTLIDISIKDGVAIVDFSREFTESFDNISQEVAVYGLVNTLTQFPTVRQVKIRIEGRELAQLGGVDLTDLSYREGLIKDVKQNDVKPDVKPTKDSPSSLNLFAPGASG